MNLLTLAVQTRCVRGVLHVPSRRRKADGRPGVTVELRAIRFWDPSRRQHESRPAALGDVSEIDEPGVQPQRLLNGEISLVAQCFVDSHCRQRQVVQGRDSDSAAELAQLAAAGAFVRAERLDAEVRIKRRGLAGRTGGRALDDGSRVPQRNLPAFHQSAGYVDEHRLLEARLVHPLDRFLLVDAAGFDVQDDQLGRVAVGGEL